MIRTLVADDSAIVRAMLCQVLSDSKNFEITGTAENGKIALVRLSLNSSSWISTCR